LRLIFLLIEQQPLQFIIGNIVQIFIETVLLGQFFFYYKSKEDEAEERCISWIV